MTEPTEPTCGSCRWCYPQPLPKGWGTPEDYACGNPRSDYRSCMVHPTDTCDHHEPAETKQ